MSPIVYEVIPVPPEVGPRVDTEIVSFLSVVLVVRPIFEPATKVRVSVLEPATRSDWPETLKVFQMFWDDPGSVFLIDRPSMAMPLPAVRLRSPVCPWNPVTPPMAEMVGV